MLQNLQLTDSDNKPMHHATYGTVDLGGASTQISFFVPNQVKMTNDRISFIHSFIHSFIA
jgi:hypothetical protein